MKKKLLFAILVIALTACGGNKKSEPTTSTDTETVANANVESFALDDLFKVIDQNIDKEIKVKGYVTHTCKHSGKRCFMVGESQKVSLRVEAKGDIGGFNRELTGSQIEVRGIIKERKLTKEYIDQMEKDVNKKKKAEDGSAESCQAELSNIAEMKEWMKEHGKDYYSTYYMDGLSYDVVE